MNRIDYKKHFLSQWNEWYIKTKDNALVITLNDGETEDLNGFSEWSIDNHKLEELFLDMDKKIKNNSTINEIFEQNGQHIHNLDYYKKVIKDSLGQMPFMIIDTNDKGQVLVAEKYKKINLLETDSTKFYYFRFACKIGEKDIRND
ncbi:MAG: hypothetical protein A2275_00690 [Bacteroidetes bacterium RIFOXYA12_FULL_35_11]|nr:MAG: hypothetical protein A2X01_20920 [Bacteroidetes bacterium GWF2_35_48]OFY82076.1 MAG: hypothetical protein A2275_00690 [Bacteroidetes bacterium RIFOXYA12_FULL_35_11]OFY97533.1 MAG: hypothetical protein A2309_06590 [Bacteroidetes bacterium RIFOXYB2_FULL_35_7]OFZ04696.1 MAG: hypothetical protein A2491_13275 [Bacteroidetes bacterium RIFOXYC12_FULL_35_7]HBX51384.1 hypothetical protein [Bacteroidales bacterium]